MCFNGNENGAKKRSVFEVRQCLALQWNNSKSLNGPLIASGLSFPTLGGRRLFRRRKKFVLWEEKFVRLRERKRMETWLRCQQEAVLKSEPGVTSWPGRGWNSESQRCPLPSARLQPSHSRSATLIPIIPVKLPAAAWQEWQQHQLIMPSFKVSFHPTPCCHPPRAGIDRNLICWRGHHICRPIAAKHSPGALMQFWISWHTTNWKYYKMTLSSLTVTIYSVNVFTLTQCEICFDAHKVDILGVTEGRNVPFKAQSRQIA